jgi:hypothetical protein
MMAQIEESDARPPNDGRHLALGNLDGRFPC